MKDEGRKTEKESSKEVDWRGYVQEKMEGPFDLLFIRNQNEVLNKGWREDDGFLLKRVHTSRKVVLLTNTGNVESGTSVTIHRDFEVQSLF